jgi:hypothetical protein
MRTASSGQTGLTADHPVQSYLKPCLRSAGRRALVDTFLHHRARNYTVDECLDFVASAGLPFQRGIPRRRTRTPYSNYPVGSNQP